MEFYKTNWSYLMMNFCTYFDINYIHKGLALYQSLVNTDEPFNLWILCFDEESYKILKSLNLTHIKLIAENEFDEGDDLLIATKASRSRIEYFWTCTASLPLYIFKQDPLIDVLLYLDADTYFFSSPIVILDELGDGNILIVPHDYSEEFEDHTAAGIYNVGIMAFRHNVAGLECLSWWRERCIEWCYWKYENGQIGDQAYLNDWPERFEKVVVCSHIGINAAPWNIAKYGVGATGQTNYLVGNRPLVCYHFHYFRLCSRNLAFICGFKINLPTGILAVIYRPYIKALFEAENILFANNFDIKIPRSGIPWHYIVGRLLKRQPIRHFLLIGKKGR